MKYLSLKSFLENYESMDKENSRSIVFHYLISNQFDKIEELAIKEMKSIDFSESPKIEFEILYYNKDSSEKLQVTYLHDFITKFVN